MTSLYLIHSHTRIKIGIARRVRTVSATLTGQRAANNGCSLQSCYRGARGGLKPGYTVVTPGGMRRTGLGQGAQNTSGLDCGALKPVPDAVGYAVAVGRGAWV